MKRRGVPRTGRREKEARRTAGAGPSGAPKGGRAKPVAAPGLSLTHPATLVAVLFAAAGLVASVSFRLLDTDFWQHLVVGKAIWTHGIPTIHQWTWPWYGTPEVSWVGRSGWSPSWGFRALIWPLWQVGGVTGLFVWRWATTLAAFGLAWAAARRSGARGLTPLVVIVWCSLVYRHRSQIRPETLASVWLAATFFLLAVRAAVAGAKHPEAPARGGVPPLLAIDVALVLVAWAWANSHISYFLFFVVLGASAIESAWRTRDVPMRMLGVGLAALAMCFVNPYGWQVLWEPFAYFLHTRHESMFQGIGELQPLSWPNNQTNGVFVMLGLWPLLLLLRAARERRLPVAEGLVCALFSAMIVQSERFFGFYAIAAAVFLSRDAEALVHAIRWPRWTASPAARAALAAAAMVAVGAAEWARADRPLGIAIDMRRFPVGAMDFIAAHGIRGHGFTQYRVAAYQLWRFWPDRGRLPFMDIHNTGTPEDRAAYVAALSRRDGWRLLDRGGRFDYVVLDPFGADSLLVALDADTSMALVFFDDNGALYARRGGVNGAVADSFAYHLLGAGAEKPVHAFALLRAARADTTAPPAVRAEATKLRAALIAEIDRLAASSPRNARAHSTATTLAIQENRLDDARRELEAALRAEPRTPLAHFRLASLALVQGRPRDALREYEAERAEGEKPGLDFGIGTALRATGDEAGALRAFRRESARWPGTLPARAADQAAAQGPGR